MRLSQARLARADGRPGIALLLGWRADVAAAVLGALAAAALPPFNVVPVLLVSIPGLLLLVGAAPRRLSAFRLGFWFGFGHHLLGLYWITDAILLRAEEYWWLVPIAVPGVAAILAVFIAVPCVLAWQARPGWRRAVVLAGTWALADIARQFVLTGFPWNPWGSVWAFPGAVGNVFLQPAAWIGTPGLTLATVLLATVPMLRWRGWVVGVAGLLLWVGLGAWRLNEPAEPAPDLSVVLVQGNVEEGMKWDRNLAVATFRRYLDLTASGVAKAGSGPKVVVWPESASPFLLESDSMARLAIAEAANGGSTGPVPALIGTVRLEGGSPGSGEHPRNSLVAITGSGALAGTYDKWHLVPGGEYQPSWVPLPVQLVPGGGFEPGPGPRTSHVPGLPALGVLICYEAIFPGQVVDEADRPDWLVNVTNDAWFGDSTGPRQHLQAARMRAVEEGLPLLRAANTGISAGFDAHGRELARLGLDQEGTLVVHLPGKLPRTVFATFGLAIPALLAGAVTALGVIGRRRRVA